MKIAALAVLTLAAILPLDAARAQTAAPAPSAAADANAQHITDIFTKPHVTPDAFASSFTEKMPPARLESIVKQLKVVLGDFKDARKSTDPNQAPFDATWQRYVATFSKGSDDIYIHEDSSGKIDGLIFREMHPL